MILHRRGLIATGAAAAFSGLVRHAAAQTAGEETYVNNVHGYGPLLRDPNRLLDLPEGFSYQVVAQSGDTMDDGLFAPGQPDGMACFPLEGSRVALVVNHELKGSSGLHRNLGPGGLREERLDLLDASRGYDTYKNGRPLPGGCSTIVYDLETRRKVSQRLTLAGTSTNCCGGPTPWGSWLSCEETLETPADADVTKPHGWVFEVPADATGPVDPVPLKAMGRFDHEAVCIDPRTGVVYLTEDDNAGLFYRFIPDTPGQLARGGKLQAMRGRARPRPTPAIRTIAPGPSATGARSRGSTWRTWSRRTATWRPGAMRRARPWWRAAKASGGATTKCISPPPPAGRSGGGRSCAWCPAWTAPPTGFSCSWKARTKGP